MFNNNGVFVSEEARVMGEAQVAARAAGGKADNTAEERKQRGLKGDGSTRDLRAAGGKADYTAEERKQMGARTSGGRPKIWVDTLVKEVPRYSNGQKVPGWRTFNMLAFKGHKGKTFHYIEGDDVSREAAARLATAYGIEVGAWEQEEEGEEEEEEEDPLGLPSFEASAPASPDCP